jgi:hypothetical protein
MTAVFMGPVTTVWALSLENLVRLLPKRHWTARYMRDRFLEAAHARLNNDDPWLTRHMVAILDSWILPSDFVLEFGSGRSTAWFGQRAGRVVSVEHTEEWFERVVAQVAGLPVDVRLCPDHDSYVAAAREIAHDLPDLILVDGVYRDECAMAALDLVRPGGAIIIDDAHWFIPPRRRSTSPNQLVATNCKWEGFDFMTRDWHVIWTSDGVSDTAAFFSPISR